MKKYYSIYISGFMTLSIMGLLAYKLFGIRPEAKLIDAYRKWGV